MRTGNQVWLELTKEEISYHLRQYDNVYRSTYHAMRFLKKAAGWHEDLSGCAIDLGAGAGANAFWLSKEFPKMNFTVLDANPQLINLAKQKNRDNPNIYCLTGDFCNLEGDFAPDSFDYVLSFQTISWLPCYKEHVKTAFYLAKKGVFLSSLFCDGKLEYNIKVKDYLLGKEAFYNIYSLARFADYVRSISDRPCQLILEPFNIDIDLPKPEQAKLQTFTVRTADGVRMQFSGCLFLPWYFIYCALDQNRY
jgi:ubiquinone/menaquinone biosynthesis C-methylase UbiE